MSVTAIKQSQSNKPLKADSLVAEVIRHRAIKDAGHLRGVLRVDVRPISQTLARVNIWVEHDGGSDVVMSSRIAYSAIYPLKL